MKRCLAGLLTTFIGLTPSQLDGQIVEAQRRICETLGLDRSSLAVIPVEGDDLTITHSWAAPAFNLPQRLSKRDLPWVVRRLLDGQLVKFARIDDLPEEAATDKDSLRPAWAKVKCDLSALCRGKSNRGTVFRQR